MIGKVSRSISRPRLNGGIVSEWRHRDRHALIGKRKEIIRHAPAFASDHDRYASAQIGMKQARRIADDAHDKATAG